MKQYYYYWEHISKTSPKSTYELDQAVLCDPNGVLARIYQANMFQWLIEGDTKYFNSVEDAKKYKNDLLANLGYTLLPDELKILL
jgi:hypothetical protein